MGVKVKTTTRKDYSIDGKSFWIEYTEQTKEVLTNLCVYAMNNLNKGVIPFTVMVSEDGIDLSFKVDDKETQEKYIKIFTQINEDLK